MRLSEHSCPSSIPLAQCAVSSAPIHNSQILLKYPPLKRSCDWWLLDQTSTYYEHVSFWIFGTYHGNYSERIFGDWKNNAIRKWTRCLTLSTGLGTENSICPSNWAHDEGRKSGAYMHRSYEWTWHRRNCPIGHQPEDLCRMWRIIRYTYIR